ncbi:hypothetical protein GTX14_29985 [Streptomyces sp. SID4944]|nr:hypothetical protein [Streptomyces sp. SID4944]
MTRMYPPPWLMDRVLQERSLAPQTCPTRPGSPLSVPSVDGVSSGEPDGEASGASSEAEGSADSEGPAEGLPVPADGEPLCAAPASPPPSVSWQAVINRAPPTSAAETRRALRRLRLPNMKSPEYV